jgi:hypothetical protein
VAAVGRGWVRAGRSHSSLKARRHHRYKAAGYNCLTYPSTVVNPAHTHHAGISKNISHSRSRSQPRAAVTAGRNF